MPFPPSGVARLRTSDSPSVFVTRSSRFVPKALAWLGLIAIGGHVHAQNARVATSSASNGQILELTFSPPGSTQLNTNAGMLVSVDSLAFRSDGANGIQLLAADSLGGQVLFYDDAMGQGEIVVGPDDQTAPAFPTGLGQDSVQNLFGVTSAVGSTGSAVARIWVLLRDSQCPGSSAFCRPGGYVGPVGYVDDGVAALTTIGGVPTVLQADVLEQTAFVRANAGSLVADDLLVLSGSPPMLLRYRASDVRAFVGQLVLGYLPAEVDPEVFIHPPNASVPAAQRFPANASPTGIDFAPDGNLLITSADGTVFNYLPDGTRLMNGQGAFVDFASGLGQGEFKIATGFQDSQPRAFVTVPNGGQVLRFLVEADGTGTLDAMVAGPPLPVGIATTTGNVVNTPSGSNVTVAASNLLVSTIESVPVGGVTNVQEFIFEDPRESEVPTPSGLPLHRSLFLSEISSLLPPDVEIPAHVRAFRKDDPLAGPPTFILFVVDTSAEIEGVVSHTGDESIVLGYAPDCNSPDSSQRPRLFWTPAPGAPQIPEGPVFINVSNGCGTFEGLTRRMCLLLVGRETQSTKQTARSQLEGLGRELATVQCVTSETMQRLQRAYNTAAVQFGQGRNAQAAAAMQRFLGIVEGNPASFGNCTTNESGALRSRAESTLFTFESFP